MSQARELTSQRPSGRHQRQLKNYLLDQHFQLKYAAYLAGVALLIGLAAGALLWRASEETLSQSQASVELGKEVLEESKKVSAVVAMNIVEDPVYSENPALKAAFEEDAKRQADTQRQQQERLEAQAQRLEQQRRYIAWTLLGVLLVLVLSLGVAGIVVTHKVAGPIFKMKRQLRALENGSFEVPSPLRRGDELKEFFDAFNDMVSSLRDRREHEVDDLAAIIADLKTSLPEERAAPLEEFLARLKRTLQS